MSFQTCKTLSSEHKLRYFWWNLRAFWPCIDSNATDMFKAQKGKDIVKIVRVTSVVQSLFNNFFSSVSVFDMRSQEYHNAYVWYSPERAAKTDTEEKKLLNKVIIFVFLWLSHWCHMDYFNDVHTTFLALNVAVALLSMEGQKAIGFHQKYLNLCYKDEQRSYGFGTKWEWVINDRITFFLGELSL